MKDNDMKVRDEVTVYDNNGNKISDGVIININDFREPQLKYAVRIDKYEDIFFVGEQNLKKKGD